MKKWRRKNKSARKMVHNEMVIYKSQDGTVKVDVLFTDETVWLTQDQMSSMFGKGRSTITEHIQNVFNKGELQEEVVCRNFRHTTPHGAIEGKTQEREVKYSYSQTTLRRSLTSERDKLFKFMQYEQARF
jgi:hypothetical protein